MGKQKMMDIYVQEITALVYLKRVPEETKDVVLKVAYSFNAVVDKVDNFPVPAFLQNLGTFSSRCERDECQ